MAADTTLAEEEFASFRKRLVDGLHYGTRLPLLEVLPMGMIKRKVFSTDQPNVDKLIAKGYVSVFRSREMSAEALGKMGGHEALSSLIDYLQKENESNHLQFWCAKALGEIDDQRAERALVQCIERNSQERVRVQCAESLAQNGRSIGTAALIARLRDTEIPNSIRRACVDALAEMDEPKARDVLRQHLRDPSLVMSCAEHLVDTDTEIVRDELVRKLMDPKVPRCQPMAIVQFLEKRLRRELSVPVLIKLLKSNSAELFVREFCASALGRLGGDLARAALAEHLKSAAITENFRSECAKALGIMGDAEALHVLVAQISNPTTSQDVLRACAHAIVNGREENSTQTLVELMHANPAQGASWAGRALWALLERGMPSDWDSAWMAYVAALNEIGDDEFRRLVIESIEDDKTPAAAAEGLSLALAELGGNGACQTLISLIQRSCVSDVVRANSIRALSKLRKPLVVPTLFSLLEGPATSEYIRGACVEALARIGGNTVLAKSTELLGAEGKNSIRWHIIDLLATTGDRAACETLIACLKMVNGDSIPDNVDRDHIVHALWELGGKQGQRTVMELWDEFGSPDEVHSCYSRDRPWSKVSDDLVGVSSDAIGLPAILSASKQIGRSLVKCFVVDYNDGGLRDDYARAVWAERRELAGAALIEILMDRTTPEFTHECCRAFLAQYGGERILIDLIKHCHPRAIFGFDDGQTNRFHNPRHYAQTLAGASRDVASRALLELVQDRSIPELVRSMCDMHFAGNADAPGREVILTFLRDPSRYSQHEDCAKSLWHIYESTGWRPLQDGAWDPP